MHSIEPYCMMTDTQHWAILIPMHVNEPWMHSIEPWRTRLNHNFEQCNGDCEQCTCGSCTIWRQWWTAGVVEKEGVLALIACLTSVSNLTRSAYFGSDGCKKVRNELPPFTLYRLTLHYITSRYISLASSKFSSFLLLCCNFRQASALTPEAISMKPAQIARNFSGVLHLLFQF